MNDRIELRRRETGNIQQRVKINLHDVIRTGYRTSQNDR